MGTEPEPKAVPLWTMLERRYEESQGWLLFYEVANGTGYKGTGYADALAMSIWPSRGISLHGFEVKRSRSDLLKELRDENKANHFLKWCNHWWLVVSDVKFTEGVEVPTTWGILAPRNQVLYQIRPAPKLQPEEWTPHFMAAMMRRFYEAHVKKDMTSMQAAIDERVKALVQSNIQRIGQADLTAAKRDAEHHKNLHDQLKKTVEDFEAKSGIPVRAWGGEHIGEAVRAVMGEHSRQHIRQQLQHAKDAAERIAKSMGGALKNLEQLDKPISSKDS